jgi:hypothetical protein
MYQPFNAEIAQQHRSELLREAESYRLTKTTRAVRVAERRAVFHRMVVTAVSLFAWPIKH